MARIELSKETRDSLARALSAYLKDELDVEVTGFDAQFLLDFMIERLAPHVYNQGLADAQTLMRSKIELISEAISELEKPVKP